VAFQVMEWRSAIEECFEPGKEILVYRTYEELCEHLDRARRGGSETRRLRDVAARQELRPAGQGVNWMARWR
jgi:spore maturation protein CgeB